MKIIKSLRFKAGISQQQLAKAIGYKQATVSKWERGKANPCADKIPTIARVLGCTIEELFQGDDNDEAKRKLHNC